VITVPKEETIALDMTLEEAIRFIVSAGVILPDGQRPITPPACAPDEKRSGNAVVFG
jgi:uncharacterized membrane protein